MTFLHLGRKAVFSLIIALVAIPALSFAQLTTCAIPLSTFCSPGTLHVYVLVQKNEAVAPVRQSSDFMLTLRAQNPTQISFSGSQSGTHLSVVGPYSVEAQTVEHYTASYSIGCNNTVSNGSEATCVITMSPSGAYSSAPTLYPYPYANPAMFCAPAYQTVTLGQTATMTAVNGAGAYNWSTADQTYLGVGPLLNIAPRAAGVQTVNVTSGTQTVTCTLNVVAANGPVSFTHPTAPSTPNTPVVVTTTSGVSSIASAKPALTLNATYIPALPNTGFAPVGSLQFAFALVVLLAAGIVVAPYVRKTFSIVLG